MQKKIVFALVISSIGITFAQDAVNIEPVAPLQAQSVTIMADQTTPQGAQEPTEAAVNQQVTESVVSPIVETPQVIEQQPAPTVEAPQMPAIEAEKPMPTIPEEPEAGELEIKSIDTVDISEPKGNWLYKRIWWEKAERVYEKIKELTDKIMEERTTFFTRRHELDHNVLDPFYISLGLEHGQLGEIISYFTQKLEQEREEQGTLDEKEKALLDAIMQEKKALEKLQEQSQGVLKLDHALDDALMKLIEQLNQARSYEQQAWNNFKAINRELSDKRARELYYAMDTYWKNLNSINTYLSDPFTQYFDQLTTKIQQEIDAIKVGIEALQEKGIDIRLQAQKMKEGCKIPAKETQEALPEEPSGFLGTLWGWIKAPFVFVANGVSGAYAWVSSFFGGSSSEVTLAQPERETIEESIDINQEAVED